MYRRIEFVLPAGTYEGEAYPPEKGGLMTVVSGPVLEAWMDDLIGPSRSSLPANCRFYFTEKGWRAVGRRVVAAAQQSGQHYRILRIKETDAQVVWRDKARGFEVAVQPPSKRNRRPAERPAHVTFTDAD